MISIDTPTPLRYRTSNHKLPGPSSHKRRREGIVEMVFILTVFVYFLFRRIFEQWVTREEFVWCYAPLACVIAISCVVSAKSRPGWLLAITAYATYLIGRFIAAGVRDEVAVASLYEYAAPLIFMPIGYRLWKSGRCDVIFRIFLFFTAISVGAGLLNLYTGALQSIFQVSQLDRVEVGGVVLRRCTSLASNSLGTGFLAFSALTLSFGFRGQHYRVLGALFMVILAASYSRGAVIMAGVAVITLLIDYFGHLRRARRRPHGGFRWPRVVVFLISFALLLASMVFLFTEGGASSVVLRLKDIVDMQEGGNRARFESWQRAFAVWSEAPLFGNGFGILGGTAVKYGTADYAPESMYLKIAGELGSVGLLLYVSVLLVVVLPAILKLRRSGDSLTEPTIQSICACVIATVIGGFYLQNLEYDFFGILFGTWLGALVAATMPLRLFQPNIVSEAPSMMQTGALKRNEGGLPPYPGHKLA